MYGQCKFRWNSANDCGACKAGRSVNGPIAREAGLSREHGDSELIDHDTREAMRPGEHRSWKSYRPGTAAKQRLSQKFWLATALVFAAVATLPTAVFALEQRLEIEIGAALNLTKRPVLRAEQTDDITEFHTNYAEQTTECHSNLPENSSTIGSQSDLEEYTLAERPDTLKHAQTPDRRSLPPYPDPAATLTTPLTVPLTTPADEFFHPRARLIFIGDVMAHGPQTIAAATDALDAKSAEKHDYTNVFRNVKPIFGSADAVVANLETTLRTTPPYTGYPTFAAPAELAFALREAGVDVVTLANNHICDKGAAGIRSTLALLDNAGVRHTGVFLDSTDRLARNPLRFEAAGLRFALLNYTYGTNGIPTPKGLIVNRIDTTIIAGDLKRTLEMRRNGTIDCVIVSYHWGEEYRTTPTEAQEQLAKWTLERGVDVIVGGHPHVVEPRQGAVYYSLGNFVSNQQRPLTNVGMMAEITVSRDCKANSLGRRACPQKPCSALKFEFGSRGTRVETLWRGGVKRFEVVVE